jgi:hypothetical protein
LRSNIFIDQFTLPLILILHTMATVPFRLVFSYSFIYRTNHAQSNASSAASPPLDGTSGEATHAASVPCLDWSTGRFPGAGDEAHNFTPRNTSSAAARLKPSPCLPHPPQTREPTTSLRRPFAPLRPGSHNLEYSTSWCALRYEPHHLSSMTVEGQILYLVLAAFR